MKAEQTHTSMARNVFRNFCNISLKFPKRFPSFVECSLRVQEKSKESQESHYLLVTNTLFDLTRQKIGLPKTTTTRDY